jgi:hypothetical protein
MSLAGSIGAEGEAGGRAGWSTRGRPRLEHAAARLLYFHNTISTHYLAMTALGILTLGAAGALGVSIGIDWTPFVRPGPLVASLVLAVGLHFLLGWCDFYPVMLWAAAPLAAALPFLPGAGARPIVAVLAVNILLFVATHLVLFGGPYVVIFGSWSSPWRGLWNSLFTLAPTTASFWICQFCTNTLTFLVLLRPSPLHPAGAVWLAAIAAGCAAARARRPRSAASATFLPSPPPRPQARRVLLLAIDGLSLNLMRKARTPFLDRLAREGVHAPGGATTVYRALTNPAFASMMTGVPPEVHTLRDNNLGSRIRVEGLPDVVPTRIYGSIHMKHFAKPDWPTRIVPITRTGYATDETLMAWLIEDLARDRDTRLFVVDFSEVDMTAHAFGAWSKQYIRSVEAADVLLARLFFHFATVDLFRDTTVIVTSDHGQSCLDHSYLLNDDERYVPFLMRGAGVRSGAVLPYRPSIMDVCPTIAWLLGVPYPSACRARVLVEALEGAQAAGATPDLAASDQTPRVAVA